MTQTLCSLRYGFYKILLEVFLHPCYNIFLCEVGLSLIPIEGRKSENNQVIFVHVCMCQIQDFDGDLFASNASNFCMSNQMLDHFSQK